MQCYRTMADPRAARVGWALFVVTCAIALSVRAADEIESLDADFLAYLADLESDEDDWTIVETPAAVSKPQPAKQPKDSPATVTAKPTDKSRPSAPSPTTARSSTTQLGNER